jgi:hypothetical protein
MSVTNLASLVDRLPPGRARSRYERMLGEAGGDMLAITVSYADAPLWLVSSPAQVNILATRGIPRWRIWTLWEARELLGACGSPAAEMEEAARILRSPRPNRERQS